jgi:L-fuculose-phosphate aldolase
MYGNSEFEIKKEMLEIGRRLWQLGFIAANDGNITVKINDNEILTTPTGISKGFMTPDMIIKMNLDGKILTPNKKYRPSSEVKLHIEAYQQRDDINAVVHAHPPYCTSFAVAGIPLNKCVLPEAVITLGAVPIAPYGTPSTTELSRSIIKHMETCDVVLLANHGAMTVAENLMTAYHRMETLELSAKIVHIAIQLGNVNSIPQDEVVKLMEIREKLGVPGRVSVCEGSCGDECSNSGKADPSEDQIAEITRAVLERIKG